MNLTNLGKGAWLDFSASWRSKGGERLELWLPRNWPAEDSELRWRRVAADGAVRQGVQRGLEGLAPAEEIIVWTPAAETLFLRARLPTRSTAKIVQALPFALEEQLIDPPERLHFAFAHEAGGELAVAVTRRERMESWLGALAAAGLAPTHLAPVTLSVPLADRAWTLAFVDGEIVLRSGARAGLGGPAERRPPAWLHAALAQARTEASTPERILLVDAPADLDSAAWLFATLALDAIEWARLSRAASAAEEEMRALLLKSFPETRAILDPAEQMRRGLEDLGAGSGIAAPGDMLFLLARAAPAIERESRVRAQGIEYSGRSLIIRVAASEADAESLARTLRARSLDVEVQRTGGEARLRVRAAGQGKS